MSDIDRSTILDAIYRAVDEVNQTLAPDNRIAKSPDTRLLGKESTTESIALVNLIVETEFVVESDFGVAINLSTLDAPLDETHPFSTIGSLANHIAAELKQHPA